jgi:ATP-dependent Clp protease protease subunit
MLKEKPDRTILLHSEITEESVADTLVLIRTIQEYDQAILDKKEVYPYVYEDILTDDETGEPVIDEETGEPIKTLYESTVYGEEYLKHIQPIKIYLCSMGGSILHGNALVDAILSSKTPIHTYAEGECCSMAVNILIVSHKRYISPRCRGMIHQISASLSGKYLDMAQGHEENVYIQNQFVNDILTYSKFPKELLDRIIIEKIDYYFSAQQAIEFGIADQII